MLEFVDKLFPASSRIKINKNKRMNIIFLIIIKIKTNKNNKCYIKKYNIKIIFQRILNISTNFEYFNELK
jgi:hypothetical protein